MIELTDEIGKDEVVALASMKKNEDLSDGDHVSASCVVYEEPLTLEDAMALATSADMNMKFKRHFFFAPDVQMYTIMSSDVHSRLMHSHGLIEQGIINSAWESRIGDARILVTHDRVSARGHDFLSRGLLRRALGQFSATANKWLALIVVTVILPLAQQGGWWVLAKLWSLM